MTVWVCVGSHYCGQNGEQAPMPYVFGLHYNRDAAVAELRQILFRECFGYTDEELADPDPDDVTEVEDAIRAHLEEDADYCQIGDGDTYRIVEYQFTPGKDGSS